MDEFIDQVGVPPTEADKVKEKQAAVLALDSDDPDTAFLTYKGNPQALEAKKAELVPAYRKQAVEGALESDDPVTAVAAIKAEANTPAETNRAFDLSVFYDDGKSASERINTVANAFKKEIDQYRFVDPRTMEPEKVSAVGAAVDVISQLMTNTPFIDIQKEAVKWDIVGADSALDLNNTVQSIVNWYNQIPDDMKAEQVRLFMSGLKDRSGFLFENNFDFDSMITHLQDNVVDGGEPNDWLNALVTGAEATVYFPFIGPGARAIKGVVKIGMGAVAKGVAKKSPELAAKLAQRAATRADDDLLRAMGTDPADVAENLHAPKTSADEVIEDMPYIPEGLSVADPQAAKKLAAQLDERAGTYKANEMVIEYADDGTSKATAVIGKKKDSQPFKDKRSAENLANSVGGEVIERNGGYMVKVTEELSPGRFGNVVDGVVENRVKRIAGTLLGRNVKFKTELNKIINAFNTQGVQETARFNRTLNKNYNKLDAGGLGRVNDALSHSDDLGVRLDHTTLKEQFGLNGREIAAYDDIQWLASRSWESKNVRIRQKMIAAGYGEVNGRIVRPIAESERVNFKTALSSEGRVLTEADLAAGEYKFYRILGDEVEGHNIVALSAREEPYNVPLQVLGKRDGHLPRIYTDSFFIEETVKVTTNGVEREVTRVVATAKSEKQALAAQTRYAEDGKQVTYRPARELDNSGMDTELADLEADGLLIGQTRTRDAAVNSVTGEPNIESVAARIGRMRNDLGRNAGMAKYFDIAAQDIRAKFSKYGLKVDDYSIKGLPPRPAKMPIAEYEKIKAVHRHIQNLQGVGLAQAMPFLDDAKATLGHMALNATGGRVGRSLLGAPGTRSVYDIAKTLSFTGYLALNPLKQIILQATMLPTYAGVAGGAKYMSTGKFFRDFAILGTADISEKQAIKLATKLGMSASDAKALVREYADSGFRELVDDHILSIGRADTAGIGKQGRVLNAVKAVGLDIGVGVDKKASFLFSRNRFKEINGRYPKNKADEQAVRSFGEQLSLNQNSSDTLLSQNGVISLFTQFMSHQLKMTGRLLNLEGDTLTAAEKARMLFLTTASYGGAGWGLTEVYERAKAKLGVEVPEEVDLVVKEGLVGTAMNVMLNLSHLDDPTEFAFSAGFSPVNFAYDQFANFVPNLYNVLSGGTLPQSMQQFATARMWGDTVEVVKATAMILGHVDEYTDTRQLAPALQDMATKLPLTNNVFKAYMAGRYGEFVNSRGEKIGEVGQLQGALASLFGIRSRDAEEVARAWERLNGGFNPSEEDFDGVLEGVAAEGAARGKQIVDIIDRVYGGDMLANDAMSLLDNHWRTMKTLMDPVAFAEYRNAIMYEINRKQGKGSPSEKLQAVIRKRFTGVLDKKTEIEYIRGIDLPGMPELADELESQFSFTYEEQE